MPKYRFYQSTKYEPQKVGSFIATVLYGIGIKWSKDTPWVKVTAPVFETAEHAKLWQEEFLPPETYGELPDKMLPEEPEELPAWYKNSKVGTV